MTAKLRPKDHAEGVALFRMQVLGPVLNRELQRGELLAELRPREATVPTAGEPLDPPVLGTDDAPLVPSLSDGRPRRTVAGIAANR